MRFGINTLDEFDLRGKTVLCRVDINQPVDRARGTLKSVNRIQACVPTVRELADGGAKVVYKPRPVDCEAGYAELVDWCAERGVTTLPQIQPLHVATWIEELGCHVSVPTVQQRLAGIRHLFDWLVRAQVVAQNPAISVRSRSINPP